MANRGIMAGDGSSLLWRMVNRPAVNSKRNALLWGVAWLIISAIGGWHLRVAPASVMGYDLYGYLPLLWHLMLNVVVCVVPISLFMVAALIVNRSTNVGELFSRMLFAHWPATLLLLPAMFVGEVKYAMLNNALARVFESDVVVALLFSVLLFVVVVWVLYWGYVAFRVATQRGGWLTMIVYLNALVLSALLTNEVLDATYLWLRMR